MSSMKWVSCKHMRRVAELTLDYRQVQDLERQLQAANQQINQLRGVMHDSGVTTPQSTSSTSMPNLNVPAEYGHIRDRGALPRATGNFFKVRRNIRNYGRGVFKPPHAFRTPGVQQIADEGPALPDASLVQHLLGQYKLIMHANQPVLHWPTFESEVDEVYRNGTLRGIRRPWIGVFFAVLACGTIVSDHDLGSSGLKFVETATIQVNTLSDEITIDNARTALLISIYFMETNRRSAAWIWLGSAVRTALESGLHLEHGNVSPMQAELRKRTWWSIYNWDR